MSERVIIRDATVVTMNDDNDVHFGASVVIDDDRITEIATGEAPNGDGARVIDGTDKVVMPGIVDLHYHTAIGKGFSDHLPLWEYLETCWYPLIRNLDAEAAYWAPRAGSYLESIKSGVTTVNYMYRRLGPTSAGPRSPTSGSGRCSPTTWPSTSTTSTLWQDNKDDLRRRARRRQRPDRGVRRHRVAAAGLPRAAAGRPPARRPARHGDPHSPQRVTHRGRGQHEAVRHVADRGRLRLLASSARTASPRTACGCPTGRSR